MQIARADEVRQRILELVVRSTYGERFMTKVLGPQWGFRDGAFHS